MGLSSRVRYNEHTKPINLTETDPTVGDMCNITGWGRTIPGNPTFPTLFSCGFDTTDVWALPLISRKGVEATDF